MGVYLRTEAQVITTPWIYHNASLWLISLSSDGSTRITIADKNLWATSTDTSSSSSYGSYYCWGGASPFDALPTNADEDDWTTTQRIATAWYHIPTKSEMESISTLLTSILWSSAVANYKTYLLMPMNWQRQYSNGNVALAWQYWYYRTSTYSTSANAYFLRIESTYNDFWNNSKQFWFAVRLFKNVVSQPRVWWDWTKLN